MSPLWNKISFFVSIWLFIEGPKIAIKEASRFFLCQLLCDAFNRHFPSNIWSGYSLRFFWFRCFSYISVLIPSCFHATHCFANVCFAAITCSLVDLTRISFLIFFMIHLIELSNLLFVNSCNFDSFVFKKYKCDSTLIPT